MKLKKEQKQEVVKTANAMKKAGWMVSVDERAGSVAIDNERSGEEYFFQGDEAFDLLDSVPENVSNSEWFLYLATNW